MIAASESYQSKASAINGIESVSATPPTLRSTTRPGSSLPSVVERTPDGDAIG
ncbi:MAG TPA: DUF1508 domain-containing protein [Actinomycetes bacterium]|nr:DUF1508 domain-containing protein [Actinomycetes bacterium]